MGMQLERLQRVQAVTREHETDLPLANLPSEFLEHQPLEIRLVVDHEDGGGHAACSSLESIFRRSAEKSMGLVNRSVAPLSSALRLVSASP